MYNPPSYPGHAAIGQDQGPLGHDPLLTKYPTLQTLNLRKAKGSKQRCR